MKQLSNIVIDLERYRRAPNAARRRAATELGGRGATEAGCSLAGGDVTLRPAS